MEAGNFLVKLFCREYLQHLIPHKRYDGVQKTSMFLRCAFLEKRKLFCYDKPNVCEYIISVTEFCITLKKKMRTSEIYSDVRKLRGVISLVYLRSRWAHCDVQLLYVHPSGLWSLFIVVCHKFANRQDGGKKIRPTTLAEMVTPVVVTSWNLLPLN